MFDGFPSKEVLAAAASIAHGLFLEGDTTRGMTGATMAQTLDQIGAAVDQRVAVRVGLERLVVEERPVPQRQPPAHVEWPAHVGGLIGLADRCHVLHQVGVQRAHVRFAHFRVGRVGHRGVKLGAISTHAFAHGLVELLEAVTPDTGFRVRGDVARVDRAHGRFKLQAAGHQCTLRGGVAGDAVPELGHVAATFEQRLVGRFSRCRVWLAGVKGGYQQQRGGAQGQTRKNRSHCIFL
ncbi:hypothetical protein D3C79_624710 [compost metagenome]